MHILNLQQFYILFSSSSDFHRVDCHPLLWRRLLAPRYHFHLRPHQDTTQAALELEISHLCHIVDTGHPNTVVCKCQENDSKLQLNNFQH